MNRLSQCNLCRIRPANKTGSHILSKFLTKRIFDGPERKGFILDTNLAHIPPAIVQDTSKQDNLFCEGCEKYFEILETYIAIRLGRLRDIRFSQQFEKRCSNGMEYEVCKKIDPIIFTLFFYSQVWRLSIAPIYPFDSFTLPTSVGESLRRITLSFRCTTQKELLDKIEATSNFPVYPFVLFTTKTFNNPTKNLAGIDERIDSQYFIFLGDYILLISLGQKSEIIEQFGELVNDATESKIVLLDSDGWDEISQMVIEKVSRISLDNLAERGQKPFLKRTL